jgi:hypothetical protein
VQVGILDTMIGIWAVVAEDVKVSLIPPCIIISLVILYRKYTALCTNNIMSTPYRAGVRLECALLFPATVSSVRMALTSTRCLQAVAIPAAALDEGVAVVEDLHRVVQRLATGRRVIQTPLGIFI